jgi:hypothetical protein
MRKFVIPLAVIIGVGFIIIGGIWYREIWKGEPPSPIPPGPVSTDKYITAKSDGVSNGLVVRGGDGNHFYVAGTFTVNFSLDGTANKSLGATDVFIAKIANDGRLIWSKTLGGTADDTPTDIAVDKDGNPYITVNHGTDLQMGSTTLSTLKGAVLLKLNKADGSLGWYQTAEDTKTSTGTYFDDVEITGKDVIAVSGRANKANVVFNSANGPTQSLPATSAAGHAFICKYDAAGTITMLESIGTGTFSMVHFCFDRNSDRMLAALTFDDMANIGGTSIGYPGVKSNLAYCALDANATVVPQSVNLNVLNRGGQNQFGTIVQDEAGSFFVSGYFTDTIKFGAFYASAVQPNGIVIKVDPSNYQVTAGIKVSGSVTRLTDIGIGRKNNLLFSSSGYTEIVVSSPTMRLDTILPFLSPDEDNQGCLNAFLCNYSSNFTKNKARRTRAKGYVNGYAFGKSVGTNADKVAFTGHSAKQIFWPENAPFLEIVNPDRESLLFIITDY